MAIEDYLFIEQPLIARIKEKMPGLQGVYACANLADLATQQQITPAAHVIYVGDETGTTSRDQGNLGKVQVVTQLWAVILAVYDADPINTGEGARRLAGPLIASLLRAVSGWKPDDTVKPLVRGRPVPPHYANGYGYYPFVFKAEFVFNS
ncbi:phage tail terminator protein [Undibacterium sp. Ji83W]|uniref:phage tail terminator protein n=1 Tax=Undibacterium sp. Ji83W TaxID=3413043 RepID=UPI003BEFC6EA